MDSIKGGPAPVSTDLVGAQDPDDNLQPLLVNADGELLVAGTFSASNPSIGPTGDPVPADATFVAGTDGTDLRGLKTDTNGELQVDVLTIPAISGSVTVSGSVDAVQSGTWNINNITGTVSLPTGAATETTLASLASDINDVVQDDGASISMIVGGYTGSSFHTMSVDTDGNPQVDVLTLPAISGSVTVSGSVDAVQSGVWSVTATQATGTNLHTVVDSGTVAATQSGSWNVGQVPTALTVKQAAITVGTSAVRLTTDGSAPSATRTLLAFQASEAISGSLFWGSSSVASSGASRGVQMIAGQPVGITNDAGDYYIISDAANQTVFVVEQE